MIVAVEGVSYQYPNGTRALDQVRLEIPAGEQIGWIGANGAGKSTLARHLNGLLRPQHGRVVVGGWDTREHPASEFAARVGYVFQNPDEQLFARTLWEEVAFGPRNLGKPPSEVREAAEDALETLGLMERAQDHPYDLRPAQRRDLGLASILAMATSILILDEPTTGHDSRGIERLTRVLESLQKRRRTVILISHDIEFCADRVERVVVFAAGKILIDDKPDQVFSRPDLLERARVDGPQLVRLARALELPALPWDVEGFVDVWSAISARGVRE